VLVMAITWLPYQLVLAYAAARALRRQMRGIGDWEKTAHIGAHRTVQMDRGSAETTAEELGSRAA
jgi:glycosyltransferase XagB